MSKVFFRSVVALATVAFAACGSSDDSEDTSTNTGSSVVQSVKVSFSGALQIDPVSWGVNQQVVANGGTALSFTNDVTIEIVSGGAVAAAGTAAPALGSVAVDPASCQPSTTFGFQCAFTVADVDLTKAALGIVALIKDGRDSPQFVLTNSGIFGGTTLAASIEAGADIENVNLFVISKEALTQYAPYTAADNGGTALTADEIVARGFMFGLTLAETTLAPVGGVAVTSASDAIDLYFPQAADTGNVTATKTDALTGFFFGVAQAGEGVNTKLSAFSAVADGGECFAAIPTFGTTANIGGILPWVQSEASACAAE